MRLGCSLGVRQLLSLELIPSTEKERKMREGREEGGGGLEEKGGRLEEGGGRLEEGGQKLQRFRTPRNL